MIHPVQCLQCRHCTGCIICTYQNCDTIFLRLWSPLVHILNLRVHLNVHTKSIMYNVLYVFCAATATAETRRFGSNMKVEKMTQR